MDKEKPPDPPHPPDSFASVSMVEDTFEFSPRMSTPLSKLIETETVNRKRRCENYDNPPNKVPRNEVGRQTYTVLDKPPYLVHVMKKETEKIAGTFLHPVKFGLFLMQNNFHNILNDGIKKVGRNRISIEFKSSEDANAFLCNPILKKNGYETSIPTFNITRMGVVREVPADWTDAEVLENIRVPLGCGPILKVRRINRKFVTEHSVEWKPTQTVVVTFDGQVLPNRIFCCYSALTVEPYRYPTIQCYNCCRFGHTKQQCRSKPRCLKCGQGHPSEGCCTTEEQSFCILCSGNHFATSRTCPELGRQKSIKIVMSEKFVSYAEASKLYPKVTRSYADVTKYQTLKPPHHLSSTQATSPTLRQSHKKTVYLMPKTRAPINPGYDKQTYNRLISDPTFYSSNNGCALIENMSNNSDTETFLSAGSNNTHIDNQNELYNTFARILVNCITSSQTVPDHVANNMISLIKNLKYGSGAPTVEY